MVAKGPATLALSATIPVVDPEREDRGWSRYLAVLQCYLTPVFVCVALGVQSAQVMDGVAVWQVALFAGQALAVVVLCTTTGDRNNSPPAWHPILAYAGFAAAVSWIYMTAGEVVSALKALGAASGASDAVLGLTVLAWGNSVGDLAADVAVARRGLPRMGFSATLGGPLMNLLLGMGGPFTLVIAKHGWAPIKVALTPVGAALAAGLALTLCSHILVFPLSRFRAGRFQGILFLFIYGLSMATVILAELGYLTFLPGARKY